MPRLNNLPLYKVIGSIAFLSLAFLSCSGQLDTLAESYTERSFLRALAAFGVARGLNGVISVAQGTEFAIQPAGIGVTFAPAEILDPINDLIEQFSWVMLAASTSLGIQKTIVEISRWPYFSYSVTAILLIATFTLWRIPLTQSVSGRRFLKLVSLLLLIRFGVAVLAIGGETVFTFFLESKYEVASAELQISANEIDRLNTSSESTPAPTNTNSLSYWAARLYNSANTTFNLSAKIEDYKSAAGEASRSIISLVVVFVFQTMVFPLFFVLVLKSFARSLLRVH